MDVVTTVDTTVSSAPASTLENHMEMVWCDGPYQYL